MLVLCSVYADLLPLEIRPILSEERGAPNRVFPQFLGNDRDNFGRLAALSMVDLRAVHFTQAQ